MMEEGNRLTLAFIAVICILSFILFFGSGAWYKLNDWFDKKYLEWVFGEKGDIVIKDGLKHWKPERGIK